jgi:single-stranded-DNA-specific exonuclease
LFFFAKKSGDKQCGMHDRLKAFHVHNALKPVSIEQFGGHMYAAGMTLQEEKLFRF